VTNFPILTHSTKRLQHSDDKLLQAFAIFVPSLLFIQSRLSAIPINPIS